MSHELRNPLNALLGCLEMLKDSIRTSNKEIFEIAQTCGNTLYNLIGNILDISEIENNKIEFQLMIGRLKDTMGKIVAMSETLATQKGINIQVIWSNSIPEMFIYDQSRLSQVLLNIINNSIKFTDRGGVVIKADWFPLENIHKDGSQSIGPKDPYFQTIISHSELPFYVNPQNNLHFSCILLFLYSKYFISF